MVIHGCARLQAWAPCGCAATCGMLCVPSAAHSQRGAFTALFPMGCIPNAVHSQRRAFVPNAVCSQHTSPHGSFGAAGCRVELFSHSFGLQVPAWGCHSTAVPSHRFAQGAQALSAALLCWRSGILMASPCSGLEAWHCGSVRSSRGSCACRAIQQRLQEEHCCESSERVAAAGPASLQRWGLLGTALVL